MVQRQSDLEYMDTVMVNYDDEEDAQEEMIDKSTFGCVVVWVNQIMLEQ